MDSMNRNFGLSKAGGAGAGDGNTIIFAHVPDAVDINNPADVQLFLDDFAARYAVQDTEFAFVLTQNGDFYELHGNIGAIDPTILEREILKGAIIIHNHPMLPEDVRGDSFSSFDFHFANEFQVGRQYLVSYDRRNSMEFTRQYDSEELVDSWLEAWNDSLGALTSRNRKTFYRQYETLKILGKRLEGFEFYENF
ncbi:MAG: hypothetical protein FWG68_03265 [Defluviitaleaceae bacterium]|nr:hypothetical protein [Defluviitaleaceae bacterium]